MRDWNEIHKGMEVKEPHEKVVEFAKNYLKPGMRVLDHGCGKGRHSLYLAEEGMEVHALDIADTALEALKSRVENNQLFEKIKVVRGDIKDLPFPDDYFDAVISTNVINHGKWSDIKQYFKEIERVLKSGGYVHIVCISVEFLPFVESKKMEEIEPNTYIGFKAPDSDVPHHLLTKSEVEEVLEGYDEKSVSLFWEYSKWLQKEVTHLQIIARKK